MDFAAFALTKSSMKAAASIRLAGTLHLHFAASRMLLASPFGASLH